MKYRLGDISNINIKNLKKSDTLKKIKYLDTANLTENKIDNLIEINLEIEKVPSRAKRKVSHNDILISTVRPNQKHYGIVKNPAENLIVSTGFTVITVKEELVDPDFLFAQLTTSTITDYLQQIAENSTSTYPAIKAKDIEVLEINLPKMEVQKKIGELSSLLAKKIELNNQMIDTLEEMASTLFKRWFVDFEFPDENGDPYKSSGGKMIDSELGEIPEGWEVDELSSLFDFNPRETLKKGSLATKIEMKVLNDSIMIDNWAVEEFKGSGTKFKNGDTLFPRITPCLENGKKGFVDMLGEDEVGFGSTEYIIIRPKSINSEYLGYFYSTLDDFRNYAIANMNGSSGRQRVNAATLAVYKIVKPTSYYLKELNNKIEPMVKQMTACRNENITLVDTRDTLLPKLLSGELEV